MHSTRVLAAALLLTLTLSCTSAAPPYTAPAGPYPWTKLETDPYRGKQDDIFFINPDTGWYVNGAGKIYKTTDGGRTWTLKLEKPGTYFRCIAFLDERRGFAGNIGPDYYPNVSDSTPLYETSDGGETWTAVTSITGPAVKGLCAIEVAGNKIYAAGRVGGPAFMIVSEDRGRSWRSVDMREHCAVILDIDFLDERKGFISAGTSATTAQSNALILMTTDGGRTWTKQYQSARPYEITWKSSFPTRDTGYITIQNYNPDKSVTQRYVAKTVDGGRTWSEVKLADDFNLREFGVGFIDRNTGWVGGSTTGYETTDGGASWRPVDIGKATNKIRLLRTNDGFVGYAIGVNVYKLVR